MSVRDYLPAWLGGSKAGSVQNASALPVVVQDWSYRNDLFGPATNLPMPTEYTALMVSAVHACINLIAGTISCLPVDLYRQSADGERDKLTDDNLWWALNEQFVPRWSAANGWEFLVQSLLIHGDAFAVIVRDRMGTPTGFIPVHPRRVSVVLTPDGTRLVYSVLPELNADRGAAKVYDQDDMLHVAGFGFDGFRGLSPLRYALRMTGAVSIATQEYSANFFANSARPDFALTSPNKLSPEAVEQLRAMLGERHGGTAKSHQPMLLHGGLDIKTISMPLEDVQLLATRQFQIEEIARIYGVPPFMIGHNEKTTSWGSGVEAMGTAFVRYTLRQHLHKFENEINRKLFRTRSKVALFDTTDLERADMKSMFDAFRVGLGRAGEPGFLTVEEVRQALNLKRQPNGQLFNGGTNPPAAPEPQAEPAPPPAPAAPAAKKGKRNAKQAV